VLTRIAAAPSTQRRADRSPRARRRRANARHDAPGQPASGRDPAQPWRGVRRQRGWIVAMTRARARSRAAATSLPTRRSRRLPRCAANLRALQAGPPAALTPRRSAESAQGPKHQPDRQFATPGAFAPRRRRPLCPITEISTGGCPRRPIAADHPQFAGGIDHGARDRLDAGEPPRRSPARGGSTPACRAARPGRADTSKPASCSLRKRRMPSSVSERGVTRTRFIGQTRARAGMNDVRTRH